MPTLERSHQEKEHTSNQQGQNTCLIYLILELEYGKSRYIWREEKKVLNRKVFTWTLYRTYSWMATNHRRAHSVFSVMRARWSEHTPRNYCIALWNNCASWRECEKKYFINVWQGFFFNVKYRLTIWPILSLLGTLLRKMKICPHKYVYMTIPNNFTHNHCNFLVLINKWTLWHSFNWTLLNHTKGVHTSKHWFVYFCLVFVLAIQVREKI